MPLLFYTCFVTHKKDILYFDVLRRTRVFNDNDNAKIFNVSQSVEEMSSICKDACFMVMSCFVSETLVKKTLIRNFKFCHLNLIFSNARGDVTNTHTKFNAHMSRKQYYTTMLKKNCTFLLTGHGTNNGKMFII